MSLEMLEKLEELLSSYVLEVQKIKAENRRLSDQVKILTDELNEVQSRQTNLQFEVDQLTALKTDHRKMESDRERVRGVVRGILHDLDKINIA